VPRVPIQVPVGVHNAKRFTAESNATDQVPAELHIHSAVA
jgi:hypothetical protein